MEYIGNLENCRIYQQEDGTICADLNCTRIKTYTDLPKPKVMFILKDIQFVLTYWVCTFGFIIFPTLLATAPDERVEFGTACIWLAAITAFIVSTAGLFMARAGCEDEGPFWGHCMGCVLGQIAAALILWLDTDMILRYEPANFIVSYLIPILVIRFVVSLILVWWRDRAEADESPIQLRQYGWIGFPKIKEPDPQPDPEAGSDTAAAENTT
ncbi:MAG: hypothetical protein IJX67_08990 [Oscillospiraceae bacterium]|nr:hypothetical protein [Oscillospiraceae bacterium]